MIRSFLIQLRTEKVLLRPMMKNDYQHLISIADDAETWKYFTNELNHANEMERWISRAISEREAGLRIPFTVTDSISKETAGSTSYGNISAFDRRLEVGWSWLGTRFRGSGLNFHAKYCLFRYAFEVLGVERVEIKTDNLNDRAKQALKKVGAIEEGVLRSHMQMPHGRRRDSVYYSILKHEWPSIHRTIFGSIQEFEYKEL